MKNVNSGLKIKCLNQKFNELRNAEGINSRQQCHETKEELKKAYMEEVKYWAQKSRSKWLKDGDRNTAYFHSTVASRRKRNKISALKRQDGTWCTSEQVIGMEICKFYQELTSSAPSEFDEVLEGIPSFITEDMNAQLIKQVEEYEVKTTIFSLHPTKGPGARWYYTLLFPKILAYLQK